jgi:hypothetical protein
MPYTTYISNRTSSIRNCISELGCQPIIFAGAGLSKRYVQAPSWADLLTFLCNANPLVEFDFAYYQQAYGNLFEVGEQLVPLFHKWAWSAGKSEFNPSLFSPNTPIGDFLKYYVAMCVSKTVPNDLALIDDISIKKEIILLQAIHPSSIITTNYDTLCELIFPDYTPIVGQKIIKAPSVMIGEIFKIHGCVNDYKEIVLTSRDYSKWSQRKKYLSAKLLTFFLEHPLLIVGYGAQDPNVLAILKDIDEILACPGEIVPNIFYVIYNKDLTDNSNPPTDILMDLGDGSSMRVNALYAKDFSWIYQAFSASEGLENINPKLLRALLARTYDLVRHDIPKMELQVDFATLEQVVSEGTFLPKLLGITGLGDPEMFNAAYPYTLTGVSKKLGHTTWHFADQLSHRIYKEKRVNIKTSDNQYHITIKSGSKSSFNKYSEAFVELLKKVENGEPYETNLKKKSKK